MKRNFQVDILLLQNWASKLWVSLVIFISEWSGTALELELLD